MASINKKVFSLLSTNIVFQAIGVITGLFLARYLGPELRGKWAVILYYPMLVANISAMGIDTYVSRGMIKNKYSKGHVIDFIFKYALTIGLLGIGLIWLFTNVVKTEEISELKDQIVIAAFLIPFSILNLLVYSAELGYGRVWNYNLGRIVFSFCYLFALVILYTCNSVTLTNLAFALVIVTFIAAFTTLYFSGFTLLKLLTRFKSHNFQILVKAFPFGLSNMVLNILSQLPLGLLTIYAEAEMIGFFTIALAASSIHGIFGTMIGRVLLSGENLKAEIRNKHISFLRVSLFVYLLITIGVFIILPYLIHILYGPPYRYSIGLAYFLVPFTVFITLNNSIDDFLKSMDIWKIGLISRICSILIISVLGIILLRNDTIELFCLLLAITEFLRLIALIIILSAKLQININNIILITQDDFREMIKNLSSLRHKYLNK